MAQQSENFQKAFKFHKEGKLTNARDLYMEILQENPKNAEVWDLLGLLYYQVKELFDAEMCIKKAIEIEPNLYYIENLALVYMQKGEFNKALELYNELLKHKQKYEYWFNLAMSYKNLKEWDKAKEAYYKAIELNPKSHESYFNLAYLCFNENNPQGAVDCYKKALEINPEDWESSYFLGLAYMQTKNYKEGLKYFESRLCRASAIISQGKTYPHLIEEKPIWNGEDLTDKVLYTYYEAGFGDILMNYRFMPELTSKCKKVILKPQK